MSKSAVIVTIVLILVFGGALATAALLERKRNRNVLGDERAQGRDPDPGHGPNM